MNREDNTGAGRLRFGTVDWRHAGWRASYYPDDLPEDWQLGYYANELAAVLLEPAAWLRRDGPELARWAEDAHPAFRFYLLADPAADVAAQRRLAEALGERLGGLLWPTLPAPAGALAPLPDMPERVRGWGDGGGLRVALLELAGLELRARRGVLEQLRPLLPQSGDLAVILADPAATPAAARELQLVAELMGLA